MWHKRFALLIIGCLVLALGFAVAGYNPIGRYLHEVIRGDKKLDRVVSIAEEYKRLSPMFREVMVQFAACKGECPLTRSKNRAVREDWHLVYRRLETYRNWDSDAAKERDQFFALVGRVGKSAAMIDCFPVLHLDQYGDEVLVRFYGFSCRPGTPGYSTRG